LRDVKSSPGASFSIDAAGRTIGHTPASGPALAFAFDATGLRTKRTEGSSTTLSLREGGQVIGEWNGTSWTKEYVWLGSTLLATIEGSTIKYHHQDHLSIRATTFADGMVGEEQGHYPFGEPWYETSPETTRIFTTYEREASGSLDYAMFRWMGPEAGRFLSADPVHGLLLKGQSWNRYPYAWNDPVNWTDPWGLTPPSGGSGTNDDPYTVPDAGADHIAWGQLLGLLGGGGDGGSDYWRTSCNSRGVSGGPKPLRLAHEPYNCPPVRPSGGGDPSRSEGRTPIEVQHTTEWWEYAGWLEHDFFQILVGIGDGFTLGLTYAGRELFDANENVRTESAAYQGGVVTGVVTQVALTRRLPEPGTRNFRIAPFGNATSHPLGRWPHYHRRYPGHGGSINRHRPWEPASGQPWWKGF
jgi:RHS repeat-associated protein